ncbi:MAG: hypothetical protein M3Q42_00040 [Pseudomonadota bacterium]|nr:hypothetical protein [Pseudomonadota bacterium]
MNPERPGSGASDADAVGTSDLAPSAANGELRRHPKGGVVDFADALRSIGSVAAGHRTSHESLALSRTHGRVLAEDVFEPGSETASDVGTTDELRDETVRGDPVLLAGRILTPQRVSLAGSLGLGSLLVARRPTVAVFIVGNGLVEPGMQLSPRQEHDGQRELLMGLLRADGLEPTGWPLLRDDARQVEIALRDAGCAFDLIIVCESARTQPNEKVAAVIEAFGELHFRGVRMQPGAATLFGSLDEARLLAMSGDAGSLQVAYLSLVRPLIDGLQGRTEARASWHARLSVAVDPDEAQCAFLHAHVSATRSGELVAQPILTAAREQSLVEANALIRLPEQFRSLDAGTLVEVLGFA